MNDNSKQCGVTLLELIVALAIFAVIATVAYSGLSITLTMRAQTDKRATQLAQLQMAFSRLGKDIEQYSKRSIRDEYGDIKPVLQGTEKSLEFTRTGWRNPLQQQRSTLQRVAYHIENGILWRAYWQVLDRAQNTQALKVKLLEQVESLNFRFLGQDLKWYDTWPPQSFEQTEMQTPLIAVKVTLIITDWGSLERLFQVVN